jgi:hypothetical protein
MNHTVNDIGYLLTWSITSRVGKQQLREAKSQAVDYLLLLVAGAILGTLTKVNDETFGSLGYTYTVIAVCKFESSLLISLLFHTLKLNHCFLSSVN